MAKIIPEVTNDYDFNRSPGERAVYNAVKDLPNEFVVFHSVEWRNNSTGRFEEGEGDIIIYDPRYGILVIEVKSGGVYAEDGIWYQKNLSTNQTKELKKSPLHQADRTKYQLIERFREQNVRVDIHSAIWLTSVSRNLGSIEDMNIKDELIFWKDDLQDPMKGLKRCFEYHKVRKKEYDKEIRKKVIELTAPVFSAIPTGRDLIDYSESHFVRMTQEQTRILDFLVEQKEASIMGGAGTGKTLLAVEKAKRLSRNGKVLLLCYNRFLRKDLVSRVKGYDIDVHNLHTLLNTHSNTNRYDFSIDEIEEYLDDFPLEKWNYKHVVIDEGQDFEPNQITILKDINELRENGFFYVFYDENQLVQQREGLSWRKDIPCQLVLSINCRNTRNIATTSYSVIESKNSEVKSDIDGRKANFIHLEDNEDLVSELERIMDSYIQDGYLRSDITILTHKTIESSVLKNISRIGKFSISKEEVESRAILFTTSRKFKGLESEIIILVDLDKNSFNNEENRRLFYVATSRAKSNLDLIFIGSKSDYNDFVYKHIEKKTRFVDQELSKKMNVQIVKK